MPTDRVGELLRRLPVRPLVATRLLESSEDPDASLSGIASMVAMDPALSSRVIRLANSAAHAGRGAVTSVERAVGLLGTSTVRALVAAAAFPLLGGEVDLGPDGFWAHALGVAGAAAAAAPVLGASADEAFTAGLLHDLGRAVLHFADPEAYAELDGSSHPSTRLVRERAAFGVDHAQLGSEAAGRWGFPRALVEAIRDHHAEPRAVGLLARVVMVGEAVAAHLDDGPVPEPVHPLDRLVTDLRLPVRTESLFRDTQRRYERLTALGGTGA